MPHERQTWQSKRRQLTRKGNFHKRPVSVHLTVFGKSVSLDLPGQANAKPALRPRKWLNELPSPQHQDRDTSLHWPTSRATPGFPGSTNGPPAPTSPPPPQTARHRPQVAVAGPAPLPGLDGRDARRLLRTPAGRGMNQWLERASWVEVCLLCWLIFLQGLTRRPHETEFDHLLR